jgi:hypothetical protein
MCLRTDHPEIRKDRSSECDTRGKIYRKKESQTQHIKDEIKCLNFKKKTSQTEALSTVYFTGYITGQQWSSADVPIARRTP